MENRADQLRRRIEYCRRRLAEGIDADLARVYLQEIAGLEAEIAQIEKDKDRRK